MSAFSRTSLAGCNRRISSQCCHPHLTQNHPSALQIRFPWHIPRMKRMPPPCCQNLGGQKSDTAFLSSTSAFLAVDGVRCGCWFFSAISHIFLTPCDVPLQRILPFVFGCFIIFLGFLTRSFRPSITCLFQSFNSYSIPLLLHNAALSRPQPSRHCASRTTTLARHCRLFPLAQTATLHAAENNQVLPPSYCAVNSLFCPNACRPRNPKSAH
ncbi:hypothetical protein PIB30_012706 [Stylosanthes scabra]|uniref:Uncharacterized protein n=1 Tax=Stylosanthes scabra TaxID=79078 RepID=A0ABU6Q661_9FABA|nr:hypothetical protein [Stylosanthes scabra]